MRTVPQQGWKVVSDDVEIDLLWGRTMTNGGVSTRYWTSWKASAHMSSGVRSVECARHLKGRG